MKPNTVYILGAGCSAACGYPLATDFCRALEKNAQVLAARANCEKLLHCTENVIRLMRAFGSPTIDRFVLEIEKRLQEQKKKVSRLDGAQHEKLECNADEQIREAKIATAALFYELESNIKSSALQQYQNFLNIVFDGDRTPKALESSQIRVMSYNYDRLFEMAFADYFGHSSPNDLYGCQWLNSGFSCCDNKVAGVVPGRFSFLKLHGTVGVWVRKRFGNAQYCQTAFATSDFMVNDDLFWPKGAEPAPKQESTPEPLIVFPHEKERAREGWTSFPYDHYVRTVWKEAMRFAAEAEQIWVIGYSFDPNDRKSSLELLHATTNQCEIVIQNPCAKEICEELKLRYKGLAPRLKPFIQPF